MTVVGMDSPAMKGWRPTGFAAFLAVVLGLVVGGCARLGEPMVRTELPPGAPAIEEVLDDLEANDAAIASFKATGKFVLKSPELATIHQLPQSTIYFQRPDRLHVIGRKYGGTTVLRLTCTGPEFLLELPTEKQFFYRPTGARFESVSFPVSPSDIAQEMFLPEEWGRLSERQVNLTAFDAALQTLSMEISSKGRKGYVRRRLLLEGKPWVVLRSELLDEAGNVVARTIKGDYRERDGLRFPAEVECSFPEEDAHMSFAMRKVFLNEAVDSAPYRIAERARYLREEGHEELEPEEGGNGTL